ncbi:hypothetical protein [Methylobacterium sp. J-070]|uniref:hypothetical protein n=1 Tax=Methylobacterium sp. J-070 TaxID=2836650 RepID=UPI001FB981F2|nr:hypothetical protein [Methylobacterium sp. J-070]MCJ2054131.1 hypothetical protein [Methylobacterium sp. J-070]
MEFPFDGTWVPLDPTVQLFLGYPRPKHFIECWVWIVFMGRFAAHERVAINAESEAVRQIALTTAVTIEVRDDASRVQHQAAVAALQALAEGARDLMLQG